MARRRANGDGSIYRRKDGRYEAAAYVLTTAGQRKRVRIYGGTRSDVAEKLAGVQAQASRGIPHPDKNWRLAEYLDYWLEGVVKLHRRPKTYELYELTVRLHLKPNLGGQRLCRLTVPVVQQFLNGRLAAGHSLRRVQAMRTVLSAALTRAMREELLGRNVAHLVELPTGSPGEVIPWTAEEARQFLGAARSHTHCTAFVLLLIYGLRRGEVLGLRWRDIDFGAGVMRVRGQVQRLSTGLVYGPVKTSAGNRDLPLVDLVRGLLAERYFSRPAALASDQTEGEFPHDLVFTGEQPDRPLDPDAFSRSFQTFCAAQGLRRIKLHHIRHTTATLLKNLGVPARDAQLILGHSQISVTQQIYQHADMDTRRDAIAQVEALFMRALNSRRCRQLLPSSKISTPVNTNPQFGGPGGTRTLDILLKREFRSQGEDPITEAAQVLKARVRSWVLGSVAVNGSRQVMPRFSSKLPREIWAFVSHWLE